MNWSRFERGFEADSRQVYLLLLEITDDETARNIIKESIAQLKILIPQIPDIGGKKNMMYKDLLESVKLLALYRSMGKFGYPPEVIFKIIFKTFEIRMEKYPRFILKLIGRLQFTPIFRRKLTKLSEQSKKKEYPENFVFDIVSGDGKDFDWGIEFSECAILKFFRAQNAENLMKFICPNDFVTSKYFGLGLRRKMTLAEGFPMCDQHLKRGGKTEIILP
ncbi:MAG: L-2-amino-thiazoline-4-carboxylic acid hydrolase [Clostridiaceae bacterium]